MILSLAIQSMSYCKMVAIRRYIVHNSTLGVRVVRIIDVMSTWEAEDAD